MKKIIFLFLIFVSVFLQAQTPPSFNVIPLPYSYSAVNENFKLDSTVFIHLNNNKLTPVVTYLTDFVKKVYKVNLKFTSKLISNSIEIIYDSTYENMEGYMMTMNKNKIQINGSTAGIFYGVQSLIQLFVYNQNEKSISIPCYNIVDQPRFSWRGMHLDCSRHFFPVMEIERYLDVMALYKLNTFHWHLTDDQGWRIEIKKYPLLTQIGSKRNETMVDKNFSPYKGDGQPYSGYYTQEQIKEIVAYAAARFITVVPEIEMPGHCAAALAAYPEFCDCKIDTFGVMTKWGVSYNVFSPTQKTFSFLEDILDEVMTLFPGQYIHIGGDEVPKDCWKQSAVAQQVMNENNLNNEEELQSFFIQTIEKYVSSKGKKIIGWDEILEGGLAPGAAVMSWRGEAGGIAAAKQNHYVVMSPGSHCYFDHAQSYSVEEPLNIGGYLPLEKVYSYDPTPETLTDEQKKFILGAQANLWTEYVRTNKWLEYMLLPRLLALAEVDWTPLEKKNYEDFEKRLPDNLEILLVMKYNFRVPVIRGLQNEIVADSIIHISLKSFSNESKITYIILQNGISNQWTTTDSIAEVSFGIKKNDSATVVAYSSFFGRNSIMQRATYFRKDIIPEKMGTSHPGLVYLLKQEKINSVLQIDTAKNEMNGQSTNVKVLLPGYENFFQSEFGYLLIDTAGFYTFYLTSDDGAAFYIDDQLVINNDGMHSTAEKKIKIYLQHGAYPFQVDYFNGEGDGVLKFEIESDNMTRQVIPDAWLVH